MRHKPAASDHLTLWLASRSPRRLQLLADAGFGDHIVVIDSGLDDGPLQPPPTISLEHWTAALAYLKAAFAASALASSFNSETPTMSAAIRGIPLGLILGADTIVESADGKLIGQPRDLDDARAILHLLRNAPHRVITGVALLEILSGPRLGTRRELLADVAAVHVGNLSDSDIESYLGSNQWRGKAGAYNLVERLAAGWPIDYVGDPATIMGLPMLKLAPRLADSWHFPRHKSPPPAPIPDSTPSTTIPNPSRAAD